VVFSQAVDTAYELEARLSAEGFEVYRLTGDMPMDARSDAVRRFRTSGNPSRALISSAAGGIGINLQVARRVVHFDLPWNPMALEQRVGRVHRIGSTRTILVDTILLAGSREADVFARITNRLETIVADLSADPTEREALFRRILASLDPDRLRNIFAGDRTLDDVGAAVDEGRRAVEEADREMQTMAAVTHEQRGRAELQHLLRFLQTAEADLVPVRQEVFAVVVEDDAGVLQAVQKTADVLALDLWTEPLVFDRVAASYLGLRRHQTGGFGHPAIDPIVRTAADIQPDAEKARSSTWLSYSGEMPAGLLAGSIVYVEAVAQFVDGAPTSFHMQGRVWRDGHLSELSDDALHALLWGEDWSPARKAGDLPDSGQLIELLTVPPVSAGPDGVTVRWPIAAVGIRELGN
jgi:superfamily II DNA/RNA helicase